MRKLKSLHKAAAVTMVAGGLALASAGAASATNGGEYPGVQGSPGIVSGNWIPVNAYVPVTVCGATVDVIGLWNPAQC